MADEDPTLPDAAPNRVITAPAALAVRAARGRILSRKDIEARKNAKVEEIKTRYAEKSQYAAEKAKNTELGLIEKARLRRINAALGTKAPPGTAQNFVVEKPLAPNAMDRYDAQIEANKKAVRSQDKFVPVQKL